MRGQVQGVGFRPFVFRLAGELQLQGWVRNDADGVHIEIQGPARRAEEFRRRLSAEAPALSRISAVEESNSLLVRANVGVFQACLLMCTRRSSRHTCAPRSAAFWGRWRASGKYIVQERHDEPRRGNTPTLVGYRQNPWVRPKAESRGP